MALLSLLCSATIPPAFAQSVEEPIGRSQTCHSVQLGSFQSRSQAEALLAAISAEGIGPLRIVERAGRQCVLFGAFEYQVEAVIWRQHFRASEEIADGFVVSLPVNAQQTFDFTLPSVFSTSSSTAESAALASMRGIPAYETLQALDIVGNEVAYRQALEAALPSFGANDPMHGYIMANLGILHLKAGREHYAAALESLLPVARGTVAASASVRVMAMTRSAWLLHQTGQREKALCAWREIERFSASESVKAHCRAEAVGLMMELAESGKGTHEEMRRAATKAFADIPSEQLKWRAVVELMYGETFARQPNAQPAVSARLNEAFVAKYTPLNANGVLDREIGTATYQAGLFHEWAGDTNKALDWYERSLTELPPDFEGFAGMHPHAEALGGLARVAGKIDDPQLRDEIIRDILTDHPDSEVGRKVSEQWPALAREVQSTRETVEE